MLYLLIILYVIVILNSNGCFFVVSESDWSDENRPGAEITPDHPVPQRGRTRNRSSDSASVFREYAK